MKVVTSRPVYFQTANGFSNAGGPKGEKTKKEHTGYFSKAKREERKAERKKKWGARPLKSFMKNGKKWFKDHVPHLKKRKRADGKDEWVKTPLPTPENPNPVPVVVPQEQIIVEPTHPPTPVAPGVTPPPQSKEPIVVDKSDLDNQNLTDVKVETTPSGEQQVVQELPEEKTETIVDPVTKKEETYKKTDVIDKDAKDDKKPGWSTTTKVLVGVGSALALAGILYLIFRKKGDTGTSNVVVVK